MDDPRCSLRQWTGSLGYIGNGLLRGSCQLFASGVQCLVSWNGALYFHTSRQPFPPPVSRQSESPPGDVGPCARRCARSSRRGGVEIDGAKRISDLRADTHGDLMSVREAVVAETCRKSPAAARGSWTARTSPGGGVWSGGPGPRPRGDDT